ncbi:bifunctional 2-polyprenyl-6-hydroxyphenol methylase/3-demethylubiquinol 3-O-methyltransferase UbiG [Amycolatopsis sp. EV170708-02-1]|uniref:class I SAM-dependent methyltransferase n=1 Tax=Amycolatopsis sp. EV170708-02-1 TaxID=2919322 RepID=UPI001F0CC647|nr:class I SAM-dependent methyltransferase [Amycolatopsis sp. EV170708-02-1]UMP02995.1 class I SAM-dependent methyltransferase [Amycolatopsis sp. EV170708-02-1]
MDQGAFTADGCSVEVYRLLPPGDEPEIVHAAVPAGASILELGCGAGRITHALLELGHPVVAVDDSPEMLAHVRAETVCSKIERLRLGRVFDVVLLGSHLINTAAAADRAAFLATARAHVAPGGRVLVEWHPPEWFASVRNGQGGELGEVDVRLGQVVRDGDLLSAVVRYSAGVRWWSQAFTCRRLDSKALDAALTSAGLVFDRWCTEDRTWFSAHPE